jgi:hypothetical protein
MRSPDPNSRYVPRYEATEFPVPSITSVGGPKPEPGTLPRPAEAIEAAALLALLGRVERLERILRQMGLDPEFHFDGTPRQKP